MVKREIAELIRQSIKKLQNKGSFPAFGIPEVLVEFPEETTHGDYASSIALQLVKIAKKKPMEIAGLIKIEIERANKRKKEKVFEKIETSSPGFINFFLSKEYLIKELGRVLKERKQYGASRAGKGKTLVIDYSAPNIAKPFGVGHLRSTIIGQALYNIYKFLGWKCIGDNHLGDWGTQFGKLIYQIKRKKLENKNRKEKVKILKALTIKELEKLYVEFHKEAQVNPGLEEEARRWFKKLEEGNKEAREIWQACKDISLREFDKIYELLGVKIDYCLGESFYEDRLKEVIEEVVEKKVALKSRGALIIKFPKDVLPPAMILKSDGATTYLTRDLATIKYRLKRWKPDLIIYEVGADQTLYFKQLFQTVELLGWTSKEKFFHVAHGLVRWKHGKFSTRKGETIHLEEVLEEAIKRAKKIIEKSETGRGLSEKEKGKVAKAVGVGGIKYNDLSQHYSRDIIFDWEKILNLKGNSGPYLQYTFARCQSVLRKAKNRGKFMFCPQMSASRPRSLKVFEKEELEILRQISQFPEIIEESAQKFSPNLICNFVFDLAKTYNLFYDRYPILKAETEEKKIFRLQLTSAVGQILKNALFLLGIASPEKM